tara:strand:- start:132 stop:308 length:177 start_codon:yes stop_codon:yes gene_type:complete
MNKEFTGGIDKAMDNAGILEYIFGTLAFFCVLPIGITYFILVKLIIQPILKLFKKIWK